MLIRFSGKEPNQVGKSPRRSNSLLYSNAYKKNRFEAEVTPHYAYHRTEKWKITLTALPAIPGI